MNTLGWFGEDIVGIISLVKQYIVKWMLSQIK